VRKLRAQVSLGYAPAHARRGRLQKKAGAAGHAADASDAAHAARAGTGAGAGAAAVPRPQAVGLRWASQEEGVVAVAAAVGEEGCIAVEAPLGGHTTPETRA